MQGWKFLDAKLPRRLNFVRWCPIFVDLQYGTCFMSPVWCLKFEVPSRISGEYVHLWCSIAKCDINVTLFHMISSVILHEIFIFVECSATTLFCIFYKTYFLSNIKSLRCRFWWTVQLVRFGGRTESSKK